MSKQTLFFIQIQAATGEWINRICNIGNKVTDFGYRSKKQAGIRLHELQAATKGHGFAYRLSEQETQSA